MYQFDHTGQNPVIVHDNFYGYTPAPFPHPGTGNLVFHSRFADPLYAPFGTGTPAARILSLGQPPQVFTNQAIPETSFGGNIAGQLTYSPLFELHESE